MVELVRPTTKFAGHKTVESVEKATAQERAWLWAL
jgi:hypothetical protein